MRKAIIAFAADLSETQYSKGSLQRTTFSSATSSCGISLPALGKKSPLSPRPSPLERARRFASSIAISSK